KDQLDALTPLVATADRYDEALTRRSALERQRDAVRLYFAELGITLLTREVADHEAARAGRRRAAEAAEERKDGLARARDRLIEQRAAAGGDRLGELERVATDAHREEQS